MFDEIADHVLVIETCTKDLSFGFRCRGAVMGTTTPQAEVVVSWSGGPARSLRCVGVVSG